jgi:hypothetical protein
MGQEGQGATVGPSAGLEFCCENEDHRGEAARDEEPAHDQHGSGQHAACPLDAARRIVLRVRLPPPDLGHDRHAVSKLAGIAGSGILTDP